MDLETSVPSESPARDSEALVYVFGSGELLKTVYSNGEYWDFADNMIYKNGLYYQIGTPEGRAINQNNVWEYEYFYQDHLGNTRIAFKANGSNLEKTSLFHQGLRNETLMAIDLSK